jgi:hypothetical protein
MPSISVSRHAAFITQPRKSGKSIQLGPLSEALLLP